MQTNGFLDLAALIAAHGPARVRSPRPFSESGLRQYWSASRCRADRWGRALASRTCETGTGRTTAGSPSCGTSVVEEILLSEPVTRLMAAMASGWDARHSCREAGPVVVSTWRTHLEARHRVLKMLLAQRGLAFDDVMRLNQLRRRCERWTDLFLSRLGPHCPVARFAFDLRRVHEFMDEAAHGESPDVLWAIWRRTLPLVSRSGKIHRAPNGELDDRIAAGVLACLDTAPFDHAGLPDRWCVLRMEELAGETEEMIGNLLATEAQTAAHP